VCWLVFTENTATVFCSRISYAAGWMSMCTPSGFRIQPPFFAVGFRIQPHFWGLLLFYEPARTGWILLNQGVLAGFLLNTGMLADFN